MTAPIRIQRKRVKGWRMPCNTVYVGRPTIWGNPFVPKAYWDAGYSGSLKIALGHCVDAFRAWLKHEPHWAYSWRMVSFDTPDLEPLRGKNLACWCPLTDENGKPYPCHADVLLELANK